MAEPLTGGAISERRTGFGAAVVALNVMARNCDDHTKNFSFILKQGGSWELAPAYDVTHAYKSQRRMDVSAPDEREWEVQGHYASRFTR